MPVAKAKEIIMFIGIPATGKSTFYQQRFSDTHLRINRDMLKTAVRTRSLFDWCLERGQSCVLDNTNTTRDVRRPWIAAATERNIPVIGYSFNPACKRRLNATAAAKARPGFGMPESGTTMRDWNFHASKRALRVSIL